MVRHPRFTVVIPSHNHGRLLELSAASALRQTIDEIELFIVLDGADDETRRTAAHLEQSDQRVRVFDNPKGERTGEAHRARALEEASGSNVSYLSDDDLWLDTHLEHVESMLSEADFVSAQTVFQDPDGTIFTLPGDLGDPTFRQRMLDDPPFNFVGLSQGSHTMEAYHRLARGWHPGPEVVPSDLHMWRHFLEQDSISAATCRETTVFTFPSPRRKHLTTAERYEEMSLWSARVTDSEWLTRFKAHDLTAALRAETARRAAKVIRLEKNFAASRHRVEAQSHRLDQASARINTLESELEAVERRLSRAEQAQDQLKAIKGSLSYRASRRLAANPVLRPIGRWLTRLLTRRDKQDRR